MPCAKVLSKDDIRAARAAMNEKEFVDPGLAVKVFNEISNGEDSSGNPTEEAYLVLDRFKSAMKIASSKILKKEKQDLIDLQFNIDEL